MRNFPRAWSPARIRSASPSSSKNTFANFCPNPCTANSKFSVLANPGPLRTTLPFFSAPRLLSRKVSRKKRFSFAKAVPSPSSLRCTTRSKSRVFSSASACLMKTLTHPTSISIWKIISAASKPSPISTRTWPPSDFFSARAFLEAPYLAAKPSFPACRRRQAKRGISLRFLHPLHRGSSHIWRLVLLASFLNAHASLRRPRLYVISRIFLFAPALPIFLNPAPPETNNNPPKCSAHAHIPFHSVRTILASPLPLRSHARASPPALSAPLQTLQMSKAVPDIPLEPAPRPSTLCNPSHAHTLAQAWAAHPAPQTRRT